MNGFDVVVLQYGVECWVVGKVVYVEFGGFEFFVVVLVFYLYLLLVVSDFQFGGIVQCDDFVVDDECYLVVQFVGGGYVVCGEKDCVVVCFQVYDDVFDFVGVYWVQFGGGFVEEQQFWVVDQ